MENNQLLKQKHIFGKKMDMKCGLGIYKFPIVPTFCCISRVACFTKLLTDSP